MFDNIKAKFGDQSDLILVAGMIGILLVLFTPIPSGLLDFLLIINLSLALLVLLLTFYVEKPLQFSTFPSLLLIATLFRLSLNIAATRLILSDGDAGEVIGAIGAHLVGGNYVIGMIVFLVLVVVQYVVVTNGAQRVAEVAARFTLDGMPGKQMSIDADLNMGLIDEKEAQHRRKQIEKEAGFYGAMDGASKFVKGDAIAGIIIILIDIIGGLTIGIAQMGMTWPDALHTFTLLTVGDGIVTQIPALVISTGTGIIVTRAASDGLLSKEISGQITSFPKILLMISLTLAIAMFIPGIPALPTGIVFFFFALLTYFSYRSVSLSRDEFDDTEEDEKASDDLYGLLKTEAIEVQVGSELIPLVGGDDSLLMERINAFRKQYAMDIGFITPKIRVKDEKKLPPNSYQIYIHGAKVGEGEIIKDRVLAIDPGNAKQKLDGIETKDPTYNLPAVWVTDDQRQLAKVEGYTIVDPLTVLMTHLSEIIKKESSNLLSRSETERLVERVKVSDPSLMDELIPNTLSLSDVQKVLQGLLSEKVSIRNLEMVLEVLVDIGKAEKNPELLIEKVRQKLGASICQSLTDDSGDMHVLVLDPAVEQKLSTSMRGEVGSHFIVDPAISEQVLTKIASQVEKMMTANIMPVLLCAPELRKSLRRFTERVMPHLSVVSMAEVPTSVTIKSFAMVAL